MFLVCLVLNEVFLIVCCNTPNPTNKAIHSLFFVFFLNCNSLELRKLFWKYKSLFVNDIIVIVKLIHLHFKANKSLKLLLIELWTLAGE